MRLTISAKTARELLSLLPSGPAAFVAYGRDTGPRIECIRAELERALSRKPLRPRAKSRARRDETAAIRAAVFARSHGLCEARDGRCMSRATELDHQWGRGKGRPPQSVENCRALCAKCHLAKTKNQPSAAYWLEDFEAHAKTYGYRAEAERARARLEGIVALREREKEARAGR